MIVVFITAKDKSEAKKIAFSLIKKHLAACVNITDNIESLFWWENKIDVQPEALLIIKTKRSLFGALSKEVRKIHSYSVPEIIALPIIKINKDYKGWIEEATR